MNAPGLRLLEIADFGALSVRPWPEIWGTSGAQASQALADALAKGEGRFQGTTTNRHGRRWWDVIVTPVRDSSGNIGRLLSTSRDVTERKRAEDTVRASEQQFRTLSDTMPQIAWSTRPDGYFDYFNERWYEFSGMPRPVGARRRRRSGRHGPGLEVEGLPAPQRFGCHPEGHGPTR